MKGFFVIIITGFALGWLTGQARRAKAARNAEGRLIFFPVPAAHIVFLAGLLMSFWLVFLGFSGPRDDRSIVISGGILLASFASLTWLKAIEVSDVGLRQRYWWGGWKEIPWTEVSSFEERRDRCLVVRGLHKKIVHSTFHADRNLFLEQLRKYAWN